MRSSNLALVLLACTAFAVGAPAAGHAHPPSRLVGTWRLVSFEDVENGATFRRFGDKPLGLFIYTADGDMAIQIAHPANPVCVSPNKKMGPGRKDDLLVPACTPAQMQALMDGYVAYWGTYQMDEAAGVLIQHIESDVCNGYAGTEQRRPFRLVGDRLVIGDGKTWTRVLERVH